MVFEKIKFRKIIIKISFFCIIILRIDTGGWSVNCSALFYELSTKCSPTNNYILDMIK